MSGLRRIRVRVTDGGEDVGWMTLELPARSLTKIESGNFSLGLTLRRDLVRIGYGTIEEAAISEVPEAPE